jgi:protein-tyrosine kinase
MSRIYDALKRMELERRSTGTSELDPGQPVEFLQNVAPEATDINTVQSVQVEASAASRLVSMSDPHSLGAEKFRALAARLDNVRNQRELKSLQITSSVAHEGKTLVSMNLAVNLAHSPNCKVLLIEGDLHKPSLGTLLGLSSLKGISQWWSSPKEQEITDYIYRINQMPLWYLPAGAALPQPSSILQSARFGEALLRLVGSFDWIIVDSTPLLPFVDANLWSRLVDGTLLVVREGVASVKALKKGLESIDNLNLVGVVLNDAADIEHPKYKDYYTAQDQDTLPS